MYRKRNYSLDVPLRVIVLSIKFFLNGFGWLLIPSETTLG
jgi:hypothetical protein